MSITELPSGTVTFLFTDIEGSTLLIKQLRDRYGDALADQQRILRGAFDEFGGREIDTQGFVLRCLPPGQGRRRRSGPGPESHCRERLARRRRVTRADGHSHRGAHRRRGTLRRARRAPRGPHLRSRPRWASTRLADEPGIAEGRPAVRGLAPRPGRAPAKGP